MKNKFTEFLKSSLFKKILVAGAVTATAAAATAVAVKTVKNRKALTGSNPKGTLPRAKNVYISGNSIAALAAAAYLIKDGGYDGSSIHIYGSPSSNALHEEYGSIGKYFYALMKSISAVNGDEMSVCDIIDNAIFTPEPTVKVLDGSGKVHSLDISPDRSTLKAINKALKKMANGDALDDKSIAEYFADIHEIFDTELFDFIEMTFGLRDEHKASEFVKRAEQVLTESPSPGFYDTLYYEFSAAEALENYLEENKVDYLPDAEITDIDIDNNRVSAIHLTNDGTRMTIYLNTEDCFIFTAGNICDNRSEGGMSDTAPLIEEIPPSLPLWSQAAMKEDGFGIPEIVFETAGDSMEFSIADTDNYLTNKICKIIDSSADNGISLLLSGSNWRMKLTKERVFADIENENASINSCIIVKGMYCSSYGNFVDKSMRECTGTELLYELCGHLGIIDEWEHLLDNISIAEISSYPYKTAPLSVLPEHTKPELMPCVNCYCIGGFMDTAAPAATLEQEILSARNAAYALMGIKDKKSFW